MLAQATTSVPWPVTSQWVLGLIGFLAVVYLALGVANAWKKAFAKHPPISDELKELRQDFLREIAAINNRIEADKKNNDEKFRELEIDRHRSLGELHEKINAVASDVAFIRGKMTNITASFKNEP